MASYSDQEAEVEDGVEVVQVEQGYEEGLDEEDDPDPYNEGSAPTEEARSKADDIMHPSIKVCSAGGDFLPLSGTIDTGCEDSWISLEKLSHLGLDYDELDGTATTSFTTFNGSSMEALGQVTIEWRDSHSGQSHDLFCLVGSAEVPFDVLFGSIYFSEHAFEEFGDPTLILKTKPVSKKDGAAEKAKSDEYHKTAAEAGAARRAAASARALEIEDSGDDVLE